MRLAAAALLLAGTALVFGTVRAAHDPGLDGYDVGKHPAFQTSDRCLACHNGLTTASGKDVSIGFDWRTSLMANSGRDPYWQAGVRRETIDHPTAKAAIQDECMACHMPIARTHARLQGTEPDLLSHTPLRANDPTTREHADGVSCSVCHQISPENFGQPSSFNGGYLITPPKADGTYTEFGPYAVDPRLQQVMRTSTSGFVPQQSDHVRSSQLCEGCHTLITQALGPNGEVVGSLPEQVPYQEWERSAYRDSQSCQSCHMPLVEEPAPIARVLSAPRDGVRRHQFVAGNFFLQRVFARYRDDLQMPPTSAELTNAAERTERYLAANAAKLAVADATVRGGRVEADVSVDNLGGHKLPTAYPSRRVWLHVTLRDGAGRIVFESGALHADGSIEGNDNDRDPQRYEPHYREVRQPDQVQIYEAILGDLKGGITTGLLNATGYLKDNRLLPHGFNKVGAPANVAVHGDALADPSFDDHGDTVHYSMAVPAGATGPFRVEAELLYQPVGYRWANNLKTYDASEPRRFTAMYDSMQNGTAVPLATGSGTAR
jgi:hypothetical protein